MSTDIAGSEEYDDYDEVGLFDCPKCSGWGFVDCHCGGDLCVCTNYGEAPCRVCHGDGKITAERYDQFERARAEYYRQFSEAQKDVAPPSPSPTSDEDGR